MYICVFTYRWKRGLQEQHIGAVRAVVIVGREAAEVFAKHLVALFAAQRHDARRRHKRLAFVGVCMAKHAVIPLRPGVNLKLGVQYVFAHDVCCLSTCDWDPTTN